MPVFGSANPNEPPNPGVPNASSEEPKTHRELGLPKPTENVASTSSTLSRSPFVGGIAGFLAHGDARRIIRASAGLVRYRRIDLLERRRTNSEAPRERMLLGRDHDDEINVDRIYKIFHD